MLPRKLFTSALCLALFLLVGLSSPGRTMAQAPARVGGLLLLNGDAFNLIPQADGPLMGELPSSVDLASSFPAVGDQGDHQGSCTAWAITYVKAYQERREIGWNYSPDSTFSASYIYNQSKETTCAGGAYFYKALNVLTDNGAASETTFPTDRNQCDQPISPTVHAAARPFRAGRWRRVNTLDPAEIKRHLAAGTPVLIGLRFDDAFVELQPGKLYPGVTGQVRGGHAMVITGYDESKQAFRVINSWGTKWADQGYGWIAYSALGLPSPTIVEGYVIEDGLTAPRPVPGEPQNASLISSGAEIELETILQQRLSFGERSVVKSARAGSANAANDLVLAAAPGRLLWRPALSCVAGSCNESAVNSYRLGDGGRTLEASLSVPRGASTWKLAADEYVPLEVARLTERIAVTGQGSKTTFSVSGSTANGALPPTIRGTLPNGTAFEFVAGETPPVTSLRYVGREDIGGVPRYRFELQP